MTYQSIVKSINFWWLGCLDLDNEDTGGNCHLASRQRR